MPRPECGKSIAHIGFGLIIFGISAVSAWEIEDIRVAKLNEPYKVQDYQIELGADANAADGDVPGHILFHTTPDGGTLANIVEVMRMTSTQEISTNSFLMNISIYGVAGLKLLPAFQNIFYFASEIQARSKYLNNITPLINKITTQESSKLSENNFTFEKLVEFSNVSFSYETGLKEAIRDLNIKIKAGKKIAIIGPSGSGKSTFIDILLGFINPSIGGITIDGKSLKKLNQIKYRENFAYVPQKLFLLEASLRENIIFGSRESTNSQDRLAKALSASKANTFIDHLSDGIETLVSDSNLSLSGGQKQTIGIARAMYHGGKILVLDEATSAMDSGLEEKIMDEIAHSNFKTVIAITHKPSMLKYFDKIYVFNEGTIEAHGTYEDLKSTNQFLSEMIDVSKRGVN